MSTKKRIFKNTITTIIGIVVLLLGIVLFTLSKLALIPYEMSVTELGLTLAVGYIFLMAKDSLITGLLGGVINIKSKE